MKLFEAQFRTEASFDECQFLNNAIFFKTQFEDANFQKALFTGTANFQKALFTGTANFQKALFTGTANFGKSDFRGNANFGKSDFRGKPEFIAVQFAGTADFQEAQFAAEVDFRLVQFTKADFRKARFTKTNFLSAQFTGKALFPEAQFMDTANFSTVNFDGETSFYMCLFKNGTKFSHSKFKQEAHFVNTIFGSRSDFQYVVFSDPENVLFETNDLSHVTFMNTDITRIRFGENVRWGPIDRRVQFSLTQWRHGDNNKFKTQEERDLETGLNANIKFGPIAVPLGTFLAVYRNLRENYEYRMRYDEAGEFFIREMEMKRKYKEFISKNKKEISKNEQIVKVKKDDEDSFEIRRNNRLVRNFSLIGLYYHLSRYGQSFIRPALFGVGIILLSTLIWITQPNAGGDYLIYNMTLDEIDNSSNIKIAMERSLTNFLPDLSMGTETNTGFLDFAFKIVGGALHLV